MGVVRSALSATFAVLFVALLAQAVRAEAPEPPPGELTVDTSGPFLGTVGSYCVTTPSVFFCSDAPPWLVPATGPAGAVQADLEFRLGDGTPILGWSATYDDAAGPAGSGLPLGSGDDGGSGVAFSGPPAGDWAVKVAVEFEGGDAQYFYRLRAGLPPTDRLATAVTERSEDGLRMLILMLAAASAAAVSWRRLRPAVDY